MDFLKTYNLIIEELSRFSNDLLFLGEAIVDDRFEIFERQIGYALPADFKCLLNKHNGLSLMSTEIYGIGFQFRDNSLDEVYFFEHSVDIQMPGFFLPFSPDGRGNHYCLNLSQIKGDSCPVVFWQHDFNYKSLDDIEECNANIFDWINEVMIEWISEDYNYDGTEK